MLIYILLWNLSIIGTLIYMCIINIIIDSCAEEVFTFVSSILYRYLLYSYYYEFVFKNGNYYNNFETYYRGYFYMKITQG